MQNSDYKAIEKNIMDVAKKIHEEVVITTSPVSFNAIIEILEAKGICTRKEIDDKIDSIIQSRTAPEVYKAYKENLEFLAAINAYNKITDEEEKHKALEEIGDKYIWKGDESEKQTYLSAIAFSKIFNID